MNRLEMDLIRYKNEKMPRFQYFFRKAQQGGFFRLLYRYLFFKERNRRAILLSVNNNLGGGLLWSCFWHYDKSKSSDW